MIKAIINMKIQTLILSLFILLYLSACSAEPYALKPKPEKKDALLHSIYIANHGWHTGFILSAEELNKDLPFLTMRFKNALYYEIGWGDREFYQANKVTTGLTVRTIFWPTESVVHIIAIPINPVRYFKKSELIELRLKDEAFLSLRKFISNSFKRGLDRQVIVLKKGIYGDSQFYKGEGDYYLMNTCNKWTAKGLKSAGVDLTPTFKITADSIMSILREKDQPAK